MKILATIFATVIIFGISHTAFAGGSTNVTVTATVLESCTFTTPGSVTFVLDPTSGVDAVGTVVQPVYWCTVGTTAAIIDDDGLHESGVNNNRMWDNATNSLFIPYTFAYTASGVGAGKGSPITMDIASTVLNANFTGAAAGAYSDTVTLTISP